MPYFTQPWDDTDRDDEDHEPRRRPCRHAYGDPDCGCYQEPEEAEIRTCKICGQDFEDTETMGNGLDFCGSYDCRVAAGKWPGISEEERARTWRFIMIRAVTAEKHRIRDERAQARASRAF